MSLRIPRSLKNELEWASTLIDDASVEKVFRKAYSEYDKRHMTWSKIAEIWETSYHSKQDKDSWCHPPDNFKTQPSWFTLGLLAWYIPILRSKVEKQKPTISRDDEEMLDRAKQGAKISRTDAIDMLVVMNNFFETHGPRMASDIRFNGYYELHQRLKGMLDG